MEKQRTERNRELTGQIILSAVDELVAEGGFETLGVNAVAARAGVSKMLIYRYFESMDGLIAAYIRQHDFWINFDQELPSSENVGEFVREIFHRQIESLRQNNTLRKLYRWELTSDNEQIRLLREQREKKGLWLVSKVSEMTGRSMDDTAAMATLVSSAVSYLSLLAESCDIYNGIPIQESGGWRIIENAIDKLTHQWLEQPK